MTMISFLSVTELGEGADDSVTLTLNGPVTLEQVIDRFNRFIVAAGFTLGENQRVEIVERVAIRSGPMEDREVTINLTPHPIFDLDSNFPFHTTGAIKP